MRGKIVLVSGAANGIGTAIFCELLKNGNFPIGVDIEAFTGSELERKIDLDEKMGGDYEFFQGDASDFDVMREVLSQIERLDGLVNNAGLLGGDESHGGRSMESWNKMMRAHAQSAFVLTELSYKKMNKGGSIVNMGSIELFMAAPDVVLYTAGKGAVWGMTVAYSTTLASRNIRVNMVSPGNVNTERNKTQYTHIKELMDRFEGKTPLRRSVEPFEVAATVEFLLSDKSSAMTGQEIVVDCGYVRALLDPSWITQDLSEIYKK